MRKKNQKMIAVRPSVYNELQQIRQSMEHPLYGIPTFNQLINVMLSEKKEEIKK